MLADGARVPFIAEKVGSPSRKLGAPSYDPTTVKLTALLRQT
jgi:hypothetical protein